LFAILLYLVYETRTDLERGDKEELSGDLLLLLQVIYTYVVSGSMVVSLFGLFCSCLPYTPIRGFPSRYVIQGSSFKLQQSHNRCSPPVKQPGPFLSYDSLIISGKGNCNDFTNI